MEPLILAAIAVAVLVAAVIVTRKKRSDGPGPSGTQGGGNSRPGTHKH